MAVSAGSRKMWAGMGMLLCIIFALLAMAALFDEQQTASGKWWAGMVLMLCLVLGEMLRRDIGHVDGLLRCESDVCDCIATHRCTAQPLVPPFLSSEGIVALECKLCATCAATFRQRVHDMGGYHPVITQALTETEKRVVEA